VQSAQICGIDWPDEKSDECLTGDVLVTREAMPWHAEVVFR